MGDRIHPDLSGKNGRRALLVREEGVAVIAVLWVSMLIMWLGLQIGTENRLLGEEQVHMIRRSQSFYLAVGGCYEAIARMGQPLPLHRDEPPDMNWQPDGQPRVVSYETGQALVLVEPESEKVNVNKATPQQLQDVLVKAGVIEDTALEIADRIADFIDTDDIPRLNGAEKDRYERLGVGYVPFDGPLTSLDQLLLVPGVTPRILYGFGSVKSLSDDEVSGEIQIPLLPGKDSLYNLVSVHSKNTGLNSTNVEEEGTDRIITWEKGGIYRIFSCGRTAPGSPTVVICLIVRYAPDAENGYEVLYRKVF